MIPTPVLKFLGHTAEPDKLGANPPNYVSVKIVKVGVAAITINGKGGTSRN